MHTWFRCVLEQLTSLCLQTLKSLFLGLGDRLAFGLNTLVPALASNLGSTNDKIRFGASLVFDQMMEAVDHVLLIQVQSNL